jgi:type VI secretion system protein ImpH
MGAPMGRETDALAFFAALADAPYRFDFYQTLRRMECLYDGKPRWGEALRPVDEPVRLGQDPDLSFAPAPLASFETDGGGTPRLQVRLFGLFGPNGPLPLHITEYARERLRIAGDPTLSRFLDVFHHRFLALFYRAWAQAQPHVNHDRPKEDRFTAYVGSFLGMSPAAFRDRDGLPDLAKFFHVGALIRQVRNSEGLMRILQHFFRVPVQIEEFVGHWLSLSPGERTFLSEGAALGSGAVLGGRVWDRQHKFRIHLGPLTLHQY